MYSNRWTNEITTQEFEIGVGKQWKWSVLRETGTTSACIAELQTMLKLCKGKRALKEARGPRVQTGLRVARSPFRNELAAAAFMCAADSWRRAAIRSLRGERCCTEFCRVRVSMQRCCLQLDYSNPTTVRAPRLLRLYPVARGRGNGTCAPQHVLCTCTSKTSLVSSQSSTALNLISDPISDDSSGSSSNYGGLQTLKVIRFSARGTCNSLQKTRRKSSPLVSLQPGNSDESGQLLY